MLQTIEDFYKDIHSAEGRRVRFPKFYPAKAIVGCVRLHAVLEKHSLEQWSGAPRCVVLEAGNTNQRVWLLQVRGRQRPRRDYEWLAVRNRFARETACRPRNA